MNSGLALIDWIIIALYASGTIFLGWWFGRKQESTKEYFTGTGKMNPLLIGVSLFATLLSTISYLSMPGETLGKGPGYLANLLVYPVVFVIIAFWLLPVYMKNRVTSAYELLELRLGGSVRTLGAVMFLALRLFWMSLLIHLTASALSIMMGVDEKWIPLIVIVSAAIAITYTSLGGLRAVVITDLIQTILLYGGAVLVISVVTYRMGGFGWFPTEWNPSWDTQPFFPFKADSGYLFNFDPTIRVTMLGSMLSVLIWMVATTGGDQVSVQRFMATENIKQARKASAMQLGVGMIVGLTLALVGFALLGYFQANPVEIPAGYDLKGNADKFFPHFIAFQLPPVISGLVLAGLFAAAMSSIDSGVNSITAVVMTDFVERKRFNPSEKTRFRLARLLAVVIGVVVVILSLGMDKIPGNITAVTNKTVNLLTTPIFCLFVFALFIPFASTLGVWIGAICGTITAVLIAFSGPIFGFLDDGRDPVSFQWIGPASLIVNLLVGCLFSLIFPNKNKGILLADKPTDSP